MLRFVAFCRIDIILCCVLCCVLLRLCCVLLRFMLRNAAFFNADCAKRRMPESKKPTKHLATDACTFYPAFFAAFFAALNCFVAPFLLRFAAVFAAFCCVSYCLFFFF